MLDTKHIILLVEDSDIIREITKAALEEAGFHVRTAIGSDDLEKKIKGFGGFLDGLDLMVLDMELEENLSRSRNDRGGSHVGSQMTGSQIGATLGLSHPQLQDVPFLIYSGKDPNEIRAYLDELEQFAELDEHIKNNYRGFVQKGEGSEPELIRNIRKALTPR